MIPEDCPHEDVHPSGPAADYPDAPGESFRWRVIHSKVTASDVIEYLTALKETEGQ